MYSKLLTICLILIVYSSQAQVMEEDTTGSSEQIDEIIISANKMKESAARINQEVKVINSKQMAMLQSQSTADLLQNTMSANVQKSQQGGGSTVLRGFEANRVLLMIDGVRINNAIYRAGHLQNIITIDNNSLDKVEVLYGPASTIYGSDALGGAIHFYTKKPKFSIMEGKVQTDANAFVRFGSVNNERTGHLDFNIGGQKFASLTSFTYSSFGDLKMGKNVNPALDRSFGELPFYIKKVDGIDSIVANKDPYKQVNSGFDQYDLVQKFSYQPNNSTNHGLNIQLSNSSNIPRYDRLTNLSQPSMLSQAEWYYGPQKRLLVAYDYNHKDGMSKLGNMHIGVNYQEVEESRNTRKYRSNQLTARVENIKVIGLNVDFNKTFGKHILRYGLDGQYNTLLSTAFTTDISTNELTAADTRYPDGDNTMLLAGAYVSHSMALGKHLNLNDGVRLGFSDLHSSFVSKEFFPLPYEEANQQNFVYSGNIGLVYNPTKKSKYGAGISTGFRVPNIDDMSKVFESAPGNVIVPNPDIKPEKTVNFEINASHYFNDRLQWQGAVYHTLFLDAIVTDDFTFNGSNTIEFDGAVSRVLANQNKRRASISGFSTNLTYQILDGFSFDGSANYTYGRILGEGENNPLDHIPPFTTRLGLNYAFSNFSSTFYMMYNGLKHIEDYYPNGEDNEQYAPVEGMPSWYTLNLKVKYDFNNYLNIAAGVDNILDLQYRTFASGINSPGRNFSLTLFAKLP